MVGLNLLFEKSPMSNGERLKVVDTDNSVLNSNEVYSAFGVVT